MTDIQELARKAGFIKQDMSLAHEAIEKNVYLVPSDSHLREFASLLRKKFIAELGEPVNEVYGFEKWITENTLIRTNLGIDLNYADPLAEVAYRAWKARAKLYAEKG